MRAYELVAEAYRQCFRNWGKSDGQVYVEVALEMRTHLRWGVDFDALCNLMVQFKNIIPDHIASYFSEYKVKSLTIKLNLQQILLFYQISVS